MKSLIKKSFSMLNSNIKEILIFSILLNIASFASSFFIPYAGYILSVAFSLYAFQVFINFSKTENFDINNLEEPYYKGILKAYGLNLILAIPIGALILVGISAFFTGMIQIGLKSITFLDFTSGLLAILILSGIIIGVVLLGILIIHLIFPFTHLVLLDQDFSHDSFWGNIKLSLKLAKGYRMKIFLTMFLNYLFTMISVLTLGLSLFYSYPLYMIMISNLYNDSKNNTLINTKSV